MNQVSKRLAACVLTIAALTVEAADRDAGQKIADAQCAACHGEDLRGTPLGTPLVGRDLRNGSSVQDIARSIAAGAPDQGADPLKAG
jgi:mono/diheme cytochrome c family protein